MTEETIHMKAIVVTDQAAGLAGMKLTERPEPPAAINDVIVEVEVVRAVGRVLAGNDVHNEHDFVGILPAAEHVGVGVIRRRVQGDERRFAMARGVRLPRSSSRPATF